MSACVSPVSLLDNGSVYTFPRQRIYETKNCWTRRLLCGPCRIKGDSVGLYIPISLQGNDSVNVGGIVFYTVRVV
jgi:hypothetical protein